MNDRIRALFQGQWPALIIFDLDGTLVDSVPDLALAIDAMLARLQRPLAGESKVREWVGNGASMLVKRALSDSLQLDNSQVDRSQVDSLQVDRSQDASPEPRAPAPKELAQVDAQVLAAALDIFREEYARVNGSQTRLYNGVTKLLENWAQKGAQLAIVTNKPKQFTDPLLAELGLTDHFVHVLGGDCLPERKPHPMPLLHVAQVLGVNPDNTLMVGDSRNDVMAARAACMPVICRRDGYNHGEAIELSNPDLIFDCFTEWHDN